MSAAHETNDSSRFVQPEEFIQHQLQRARNRIQATDVLGALVVAGLILVGYVLLFTLLDHWVVDGGFNAGTRAVMLLTVLVGCLALIYRFVFRRLNSSVNPLFAARMLDDSIKSSRGSLLALVDLRNSKQPATVAVRRTLETRAASGLNQLELDEVIDRTWLIRGSLALFLVTLLTCLYAVFSPKSISLLRPLSLAGVTVATRTQLDSIEPGSTTVTAGSWLDFRVDVSGDIPDQVQLFYSTEDRRFVDEPLTLQPTDDEHRFEASLAGEQNRGLRQNLTYFVRAGDASSQVFTITVVQPPAATLNSVTYQYPGYMQLPEHSSTDAAIRTWEDTVISLQATSNVPLRDAVLQLSDDPEFPGGLEEISLSISGLEITGKWQIAARSDGSFPAFCRIQVTDKEGAQNPSPTVYPIEVRRDQPPLVRLLDPTADLQVPRNAVVPFLVQAEDPDFLLRNVSLHYAINGQPPQPAEYLMEASREGAIREWIGAYELQLSQQPVQAGDVVTCYAEARDNRPPLGSAARSTTIRLQITAEVSEEQVAEQLRQDREIQQQMKQSQETPTEPRTESEQDAPPEPNSQQSDADGSNAPDAAGQSETDRRNSDGAEQQSDSAAQQQSPATDRNSDDAASGSASDMPSDTHETDAMPTENSSDEESSRGPADDNEALQQLINQLNRDAAMTDSNQAIQDQNDSQDQPNDGSTEDRQPTDQDQQIPQDGIADARPDDNGLQNPNSPSDDGMPNDPGKENGNDSPDSNPMDDAPTQPDPDSAAPATTDPEDKQSGESNSQSTDDPTREQPAQSESGTSPADEDPQNSADSPNQSASGEQQKTNDEGTPATGDDADSRPDENTTQPAGPQSNDERQDMSGDKQANPGNADEQGNPDSSASSQDQNSSSSQSGSESESSNSGDSSSSSGNQNSQGQSGSPTKSPADANGSSGGDAAGSQSKGGESSSGSKGTQGNEGSKASNSPSQDSSSESGSGASQQNQDTAADDGQQDGAEGMSPQDGSREQQDPSGKQRSGKPKSGDGQSEPSSNEQSGDPSPKSTQDSNAGPAQNSEAQSTADSAEAAKTSQESENGQPGSQQQNSQKDSQRNSQQSQGSQKQSGGDSQQGSDQGGGKKPQGGEGGGGQQPGGGGQGPTGKPGASGGVHSGNGKPGSETAEFTEPEPNGKSPVPEPGSGVGGAATDPDAPEGSEGSADQTSPQTQDQTKPDPQEVDRAAKAANLALRRIRQDLDRGRVDKQLLEELGWTEQQLQDFTDRMEKRLQERSLNSQQQQEQTLSQKSFDEMLRSLDLQSSGSSRIGDSSRDRDRVDTTLRRSVPPAKYRQAFEAYQRSLSGASRKSPPGK